MKKPEYFEMFVPINQTTQLNTPQDSNFNFHRRLSFKTSNNKYFTVNNTTVLPTCEVVRLTRIEDNGQHPTQRQYE
jgi:hypothetical protein